MKYEFTGEILRYDRFNLHRIRRIKDGKIGGWIESVDNLSQDGNCWVDGEAKVCGEARVYENAIVSDEACVCGKAKVFGSARVAEHAYIGGRAEVFDNAFVCSGAYVSDEAQVYDSAIVEGCCLIIDAAKVFERAVVKDSAIIGGNAMIYGHATILGAARIECDGDICEDSDYLTFQGLGFPAETTAIFICADETIKVCSGAFTGTLADFENDVRKNLENSKHIKEYLGCVEIAKIHFNLQ